MSISTTVVINQRLRVIVGNNMSEIYSKLRSISGKKEDETLKYFNRQTINKLSAYKQSQNNYRQ